MFRRFEDALTKAAELRAASTERVSLFIGTDVEIGSAHGNPEQRVGVVPEHVGWLKSVLHSVGVDLEVLVHSAAGKHAGFEDEAYKQVGATIVTQADFMWLRPDVVTALKEPSSYEAKIPGPFCRIGALHTGDFQVDSGFTRLLEKADVAIFDGSCVGDPASYRVPIRGSMSIFAGEIAADWVIQFLAERDLSDTLVIVVGGGNVGQAAARRLTATGRIKDVVIFEKAEDDSRFREVVARMNFDPRVSVRPLKGIDDQSLLDLLPSAAGIIFGVATPNQRAPRVVTRERLHAALPSSGAYIVDVSIDERGAIEDQTASPDWSSTQLIPHFERMMLPHTYKAVTNMPRAHPREASIKHSEIIVPYVATLLWCRAQETGVPALVQRLRNRIGSAVLDPSKVAPADMMEALECDLARGLAIAPVGEVLYLGSTIPGEDLGIIQQHLNSKGIKYVS